MPSSFNFAVPFCVFCCPFSFSFKDYVALSENQKQKRMSRNWWM